MLVWVHENTFSHQKYVKTTQNISAFKLLTLLRLLILGDFNYLYYFWRLLKWMAIYCPQGRGTLRHLSLSSHHVVPKCILHIAVHSAVQSAVHSVVDSAVHNAVPSAVHSSVHKTKILTKPCAQSLNKNSTLWPNFSFQFCTKLSSTRFSASISAQ